MTDRRRLVVAVGLVAMAGGVVLLAVPGVGSAVVPSLLAVGLVVGVGVAALWVAATQFTGGDDAELTLPRPESRPTCRTPGDDFAALRDGVTLSGRRELDEASETGRERLHAALEALAVDVVGRTDGWDARTAADRLADGAWTDDGEAAAFFADGLAPPVPRRAYLPVGDTDLPVARRARHAVAALAERAGLTGVAPDPTVARGDGPSDGPYWPTDALPQRRSTGLTRGITAAVLAVSAVGVAFGRPGVVLTGALGIALAGTARLWAPSADVELSRALSTDAPEAGERVTVTTTVRNTGGRTLPDIRLLDGVPAGLAVVDGSPRFTTALRPGKAVSWSYTVEAVPGRHTFEPAVAVVGDPVGATELVTATAVADGPTELDCGFGRPSAATEAPRPQVTLNPGQRVGSASGAGVEFDAIREYRPGDPPARIDWNRRARTGDLSTVEFREPRLSRVAVLVDTRPAAYVAATPDAVPGPRHGARAAAIITGQLLADGVPVGVGTVPVDAWLPPAAGPRQRADVRDLLAGDDAVPWTPPDDAGDPSAVVAALTARLDADTQVVFVSPCADDDSVDVARRLEVEGHSVTVVSPDCTETSTVDGAYGHLTRWLRLGRLRADDIPVCDWRPDDGIEGVSLRARQ